VLADERGERDAQHREFSAGGEVGAPRAHLTASRWGGNGGPPKDRRALFKAFIAKAIWDFPTTRDLLDAIAPRPALRRLCGWETQGEVPAAATFSRAFAAFAQDELPHRLQAAMIVTRYGDQLAGHVSRDATAIHAREKAVAQPDRKTTASEMETDPAGATRRQRQLGQDGKTNIAARPRGCDWGGKKNSKGKVEYWRGANLHLDPSAGDLPVSWLVTSASLHDSPAAIPLAQLSAQRIASRYALAAAAAKAIRELSQRLGQVALSEHHPRRGEKREFSPAEAVRYRERRRAERVNAHLHANHGGRQVLVRGAIKVTAHLACGLLVMAAAQLLKLLTRHSRDQED